MSKIICDLPENEKEEIEKIFERKVALENLAKLTDVTNNAALYEKLITDYGETVIRFQAWWNNAIEKYQLQGKNVHVDFENSQLVEE